MKKKKKRSDSELLQKNGGIIRPTGIFFETFWVWGFWNTFLKKKSFPSFLFSSFSLSFSLSYSLHLVSLLHLVLLLLSSCPLSSLLSIFSSLVFNLLFHLHVSLLSSLISSFLLFHLPVSSLLLSRLLFSCLVLSLFLCLFLCLSLFLSSFSVSLCLCLCVSLSLSPCGVVVLCGVVWCVWCVCVLCCVVCCVVLCVCGVVCGAAWHAEKTSSVCRFKTSPCVPAPRAHVLPHAGVVPVHRGTFSIYTRRFLRRTHGERRRKEGDGREGHRQFC